MKKIIMLLGIFTALAATAQHFNNEPFDQQQKKYSMDAGMLSLVAEKPLLELKEQTMLTVRINWVNSDADAESGIPQQYDYRFEDPSKAPWKITQWQLLNGGGELKVGSENYYAVYHAPATMPHEKSATIVVTLMPQDPTKPKVQLLQTIYFEDNDNVFYFDCGYLGIHQEKYVIKNNGGSLANADASAQKAIDKNIKKAKPRAGEYSMKAAAGEVAATSAGFDLSLLTSNAKAIYSADEDVTTIMFNSNNIEMVRGVKTQNKRTFSIVLSFPGKGTGSFKIKTNKKISATVTLPSIYPGYACSCADDPDAAEEKRPSCMGGTIYITKYDGKEIEGSVAGYLESQDGTKNPPPTFYSTLNGTFKVKLAN